MELDVNKDYNTIIVKGPEDDVKDITKNLYEKFIGNGFTKEVYSMLNDSESIIKVLPMLSENEMLLYKKGTLEYHLLEPKTEEYFMTRVKIFHTAFNEVYF